GRVCDHFPLLFHSGCECLFRYYSYGLEKKFRLDIFKDFQEETVKDYEAGQLYGLEKFWAFLKYSKAKNLDIDPKLQEYLGKFRRLEDFRVDISVLFRAMKQSPAVSGPSEWRHVSVLHATFHVPSPEQPPLPRRGAERCMDKGLGFSAG
uniref:Uncharacterized protein n=1 Tax=Bos mutus grunniens TaxID=30521 RepID=A0A8B9XA21_BOSMU